MTEMFALRWRSFAPSLLSILRIAAGFVFIQSGTAKLFCDSGCNHAGRERRADGLIGVASVLETIGGLLLLVGQLTRPIAFLLSGEMAFAYFIGHAPMGFWTVLNRGHPPPCMRFSGAISLRSGPGRGAWTPP